MARCSAKTEEEEKGHREASAELRLNHACFLTTTYLQRLAETYPLKTVLDKYIVSISWDKKNRRAVVTLNPR